MYVKYFSYLQDAIEEPFGSTVVDDIPIVDEIPGSTTLWEVTPRPSNSSDVSPIDLSSIEFGHFDRLIFFYSNFKNICFNSVCNELFYYNNISCVILCSYL